MKRIILVAAVWMGVSAAQVVSAKSKVSTSAIEVREDGSVDMNVEMFKDMKFRVSVKNLTNRSYIAIKRVTGEVLYSEYAHKTDEYSKVFDLSNLLDGAYVFVVETDQGSVEKPFTIKTETTRVVTPTTTR